MIEFWPRSAWNYIFWKQPVNSFEFVVKHSDRQANWTCFKWTPKINITRNISIRRKIYYVYLRNGFFRTVFSIEPLKVCSNEVYFIANRDISSPWTRQVHLTTQKISSHHPTTYLNSTYTYRQTLQHQNNRKVTMRRCVMGYHL